MKKVFVLFIALIILVISFYIFLPSNKNFVFASFARCAEPSVARQITNKHIWKLWWPGEIKNDTLYNYQNCTYRIDKILLNGFQATVFHQQDSLKGFLQYIYVGNDSTAFQWTSIAAFSNNPIKRLNQFIKLKKIAQNIQSLLNKIKTHFDNQEKVYGMLIKRETVSIPTYLSTKSTFKHYPTTREVYEMIESLKEYINKIGGEETLYPMLHIEYKGPEIYDAMVAIPTKTELPSNDKFQLKKMILGNILTAEVKGGIYSVINGEQEFKNYINDYKILSPAIPFQSLITNRLKETDSTKWITKLNYPIFQ